MAFDVRANEFEHFCSVGFEVKFVESIVPDLEFTILVELSCEDLCCFRRCNLIRGAMHK